MVIVSTECKKILKLIKESVKDDPINAIELYMQAAQCFASNNNIKSSKDNLEKAAKLLQSTAKSNADPLEALIYYEESSSIFKEIGKESQGQKVITEAHQKLINAAKVLRSEGRKIRDPKLAEEKFKIAAEYALKGNNEILSNECWKDLGDQFRLYANDIEDPSLASEFYKLAILNYKKGHDRKKEFDTLTDLGDKFKQKADDLFDKQKDLIFAFDNYLQANTIYSHTPSEKKTQTSSLRVQEIVDTIGIPKELLVEYLIRHEVNPGSIFNNSKNNKEPQIRDVNKSSFEDYDNYEIVEPQYHKGTVVSEPPKPPVQSSAVSNFPTSSTFEPTAVKENFNVENAITPQIHNDEINLKFENKKENANPVEIDKLYDDFLQSSMPEPPTKHNKTIQSHSNVNYDRIGDSPPAPPKVINNYNSDPSVISKSNTNEEYTASITSPSSNIPSKDEETLVMTDRIVDMLKEQGYVSAEFNEMGDLFKIPEYVILSIILSQYPISLDHLEEISQLESISLTLSNLQADGLIEQTNDYQWTISDKIKDEI